MGTVLLLFSRGSLRSGAEVTGHPLRRRRADDRRQLLDFVDQMSPTPKAIVCHHGDYHKCNELGKTLRERYRCRTYAPRNLETVRLF